MLAPTKIKSLLSVGTKCERKDKSLGRGYGALVLRIIDKGKGEWYLRWTVEGRTRYHLISKAGPGGDPLEDIRAEYERLGRFIKQGLDPVEEKERLEYEERLKELERSEQGTVRDLFKAYVAYLEEAEKPSAYDVEQALLEGKNAAVKALGERVLARDISPRQVQKFLRGIHDRGAKSMADRMRSYIQTAYNFGMKHENNYWRPMEDIVFGIESNPVAGMAPYPKAKNAGERYLSPDELRVFWNEPVKHGMNPRFHCALKLIIAIGGVRVQEVVKAEKGEYDPETSRFLIPEERTKNRMEHTLPVSVIAEELIDEAHILGVPESRFLFPACFKRLELIQPFTFTSMNTPLTKFCKKVGMEHWTPRDLRRTARTMLEDNGLSEEALDIYFNHGRKNSVTKKHYNKSEMLNMKTGVALCWEDILGQTLWGK